ncbi:hypothetical protein [Paenibacillus macquariensis]|uniref:hypothetical protein n=1 Tax=Paenibacillus macquariensis TaxID=948756 RepID=UPI0011156708|nr:hypothetical protein [Paenibacillus macquariensis]MEC0089313.1 hypothetical protein [Paenibacillus macquariensis]
MYEVICVAIPTNQSKSSSFRGGSLDHEDQSTLVGTGTHWIFSISSKNGENMSGLLSVKLVTTEGE